MKTKFTKLFSLRGGVLFLMLFTLMTLSNCRKTDYYTSTNPVKFDETRFFLGTEQANSAVKKVAAFLKDKQMANPNFLPSLVQNNGYPIWNKTISNINNLSNGRTTTETEQDTIIKIPFAHQNSNNVNAFIEAVLNDSINVGLFEKSKYTLLPKGTITDTALTAEKYLNEFFFLQNAAFNHASFKITDSLLFKTLLPNNNGIVKYISISEGTNNSNQVNSFPSNGCFTYKTYYTTVEGDNNNPVVVQNTVYHTICFQSVQSILQGDGGGMGSVNSFDWSSLLNTGGAGGSANNGSGTTYSGNPYTGYTPINPFAMTMGFVIDEELFFMMDQLSNYLPNLTDDEEGFMLLHKDQLIEVLNFLNSNNTQEDKERVKQHIIKMINDQNYKDYVLNYTVNNNNGIIWWKNTVWVNANIGTFSDDNFNFYMYATKNPNAKPVVFTSQSDGLKYLAQETKNDNLGRETFGFFTNDGKFLYGGMGNTSSHSYSVYFKNGNVYYNYKKELGLPNIIPSGMESTSTEYLIPIINSTHTHYPSMLPGGISILDDDTKSEEDHLMAKTIQSKNSDFRFYVIEVKNNFKYLTAKFHTSNSVYYSIIDEKDFADIPNGIN